MELFNRTTMPANALAQRSATQKRTHSGASTATAISSAGDSALWPPPSKHGKKEPSQVFTFENNSKLSQDSFNKTTDGMSASHLVSIT